MRRRVAAGVVALLATAACAADPASSPQTSRGEPTATTTTATGSTDIVTDSSKPSDTAPPTSTALDDLGFGLVEIAEVSWPTALAVRVGDPAVYVTSVQGRVMAIRPGEKPSVALDLTSRVQFGGEQGLLGIAFARDGRTVYVNYTVADASAQVDSYRVSEDGTIDASSRQAIITIAHPDYSNHNGGNLVIGPDNMLYISTGDGGSGGDPERNGQDLSSLLGKILRIEPLPDGGYQIPTDNPFIGIEARPEIWAYGLRNPWRFSFDRDTGDLWIGDVGQDKLEEINLATAASGGGRGVNFGWSAYEGSERFNDDQQAPNAVPPIYEYEHGDESASVIGGFMYRGISMPGLLGTYLFGDSARSKVWALRPRPDGGADVAEIGTVKNISSFGEDTNGELYVLSYDPGIVYRLEGLVTDQ